ncbi:MAG: hypothetical protein H6556_24925 [Lewinellaceae bacterium]|nr:hypothetical protein [Lewinellaceae bacterium]
MARKQGVELNLKIIKNDKGFRFDWDKEKGNEVYKLYILGEEEQILGIVSLIDMQEELRIHLNLIEVSRKHVGKLKRLDNIAGCLIAFACSIAFKRNYGGFVSLLPKTELIDLYQDKYGFRQYGRLLAVEFESSKLLIEKYIGDE